MTFDFGSQDLFDELKIKNKELENKVKNLENQMKNVYTPNLSPKASLKVISNSKKILKLEPTLLLKK